MIRTDRFGRRGCYKCENCGKRTREVDANVGTQLCELCAIKIESGNSLSDGGYDGDAWGVFDSCQSAEEVYDRLTAELAKMES